MGGAGAVERQQVQTEDIEAQSTGEKETLTGAAKGASDDRLTIKKEFSVAAKDGLKKYLLVMSLLVVLLLEAFGVAVLVDHWTDIYVPAASVSLLCPPVSAADTALSGTRHGHSSSTALLSPALTARPS